MEWINVKDHLPDTDDEVLVIMTKLSNLQNYGPMYRIAWYDGRLWSTVHDEDINNNADYRLVSHWMPLPIPPTEHIQD